MSDTNELICWGNNKHGQTNEPARGSFHSISDGASHSCAVNAEGGALCWGSNVKGQEYPPAGEHTQITSGSWHICALWTFDHDCRAARRRSWATSHRQVTSTASAIAPVVSRPARRRELQADFGWRHPHLRHLLGRSLRPLLGLRWRRRSRPGLLAPQRQCRPAPRARKSDRLDIFYAAAVASSFVGSSECPYPLVARVLLATTIAGTPSPCLSSQVAKAVRPTPAATLPACRDISKRAPEHKQQPPLRRRPVTNNATDSQRWTVG